MVFVSSFHPRGGVFCCSWRDGAVVVFFPRRDGAVVVFFRGGTGRLFFFSEAGRGGFFSFFRRDGTGRCFFFFRGPGRDGCFRWWQLFWRDGAKSLHRPASRPRKALKISYLHAGRACVMRASLFSRDVTTWQAP